MPNNKETIKIGWSSVKRGDLFEYLNLGRDPGAYLPSCGIFHTAEESLQQERPNPPSVMKSRRRIKRSEAPVLRAAVRGDGAGPGV